MARCAGFSTAAAMQLWEFGTLPGKTWLRDEMINARSEFVHFRHIARNPLHQVEYFSLSTHFYEEASILYDQTPQVYSMNLINIHARLHSGNYRGCTFMVRHHDSGTPRPANPKIINVLAWVFNGLDIPIPEDIATADGPQQPTGSGSCAVVVHNYLEHFADPAQSLWMPAWSQSFLYHLCAVGKGVFSSWTRPFAGSPGLHHIPPGSPIPRLVVPCQDYCMFEIELTHPIFEYLKIPQHEVRAVPIPSRSEHLVHAHPINPPKHQGFIPVEWLFGVNPVSADARLGHSSAPFKPQVLTSSDSDVIDLTLSPAIVLDLKPRPHPRAASTSTIVVSSDSMDSDGSWQGSSSSTENTMPEASDLWRHTPLLSSPPKMSKQGSRKAKIAKMKGDPNNDEPWLAPIILSDCDPGGDIENTRQLPGVPSNAPKIGAVYESFEDAKLQISAFEEKKGNVYYYGLTGPTVVWLLTPSNKPPDGGLRTVGTVVVGRSSTLRFEQGLVRKEHPTITIDVLGEGQRVTGRNGDGTRVINPTSKLPRGPILPELESSTLRTETPFQTVFKRTPKLTTTPRLRGCRSNVGTNTSIHRLLFDGVSVGTFLVLQHHPGTSV
ncbi:hypothetical protein K439DRAFT_1623305 [Ramaria rubella]|nr:hypothetical protein K439DRAFT_1623305 [Ramaria rubella]